MLIFLLVHTVYCCIWQNIEAVAISIRSRYGVTPYHSFFRVGRCPPGALHYK